MTKYLYTENYQRSGFIQLPVLLGLLAALFLPVSSFAHGQGESVSAKAKTIGTQQKSRAEDLTLQLSQMIQTYLGAENATEKSSFEGKITAFADERRQLLIEIMEKDPAFVQSMSVTDSALNGLPDSILYYMEQMDEVEGELLVLHVDAVDEEHSRYQHFLITPAGQRFSLHFATNPPGLVSGAVVRAQGKVFNRPESQYYREKDNAMLIESAKDGLLILAKGKPNGGGYNGGGNNDGGDTDSGPSWSSLGERRILVILVNFSDNQSEPWTPAFAQNVVFGDTNDFMFENSSQQTWLNGDVAGWFTIDLSSTVCDVFTLASQARSAATADGFILSDYHHIVYSFPKYACSGLGLGTVGGNPSEAWIIGTPTLDVVSHELGHNLGLYHAEALDCGSTVLDDSCTIIAYGNAFDAMGNTNPGHYNAYMKERLGWLNAGDSPEIITVQNDGTYMLDAYESAGTGPKALKILKSTDTTTGEKTWYYIESRQAIGFDSFISDNSNVLNGVLIHTGKEIDGDSSLLLDMTPGSESRVSKDWLDPALITGESYSDSNAGLTVMVDSVTSSGAVVTVMFDSGSGGGGGSGAETPTVSVSTDLPAYTKGQTVTVTTRVSSDGNPVSSADVSFKIIKPNGAISNANATTGIDGIAVYKMRLKRRDPVGIYEAESVVMVDASSGSASTQFSVQ